MEKDFDTWNRLKKGIHTKGLELFCHPREIWWCSLGLNVGSEEDGKNELYERPVLVIKAFNAQTARVIPLSSKLREDSQHVLIFFNGKYSATKLSQLKTVSTKRLSRKLTILDDEQYKRVIDALRDALL